MTHPTGPRGAGLRPVPGRLPPSLVPARVAQYLADAVLLLPMLGLVTVVSLMPLWGVSGRVQGWWALGSLVLLLTVLVTLFVVVPVRLGGRTLAMRFCGLRVVGLDGSVPTTRQHVVRLLGLFLDTSGNGLVGLLTLLLTPRRQRLGDLMAGTTVVWDEVRAPGPPAPLSPRRSPDRCR